MIAHDHFSIHKPFPHIRSQAKSISMYLTHGISGNNTCMHSFTSHLALHFPPLLIIVNYAQQHNCKDEAHWKKSGVSLSW